MRVAAIIPAYNEERTIGEVLKVLRGCPEVDEVVVVSDGSTDRTAEVAAGHGAEVVVLEENVGKGGAMRAGAAHTQAEVLLFIDADLIGLRPGHVRSLLEPVTSGRAEMSIGVFEEGRITTDLAQRLAPFLSGQRAMRRHVIESLPDIDRRRFGVEAALHRFAEESGLSVEHVCLKHVAQVMKEEKMGFVKGFGARLRMYWEILRLSR